MKYIFEPILTSGNPYYRYTKCNTSFWAGGEPLHTEGCTASVNADYEFHFGPRYRYPKTDEIIAAIKEHYDSCLV